MKIKQFQIRETKEFKYGEDGQKKRVATIVFVDNEFAGCKFLGVLDTYSYGDWMFLKEVAKEIEKLKASINPKKK